MFATIDIGTNTTLLLIAKMSTDGSVIVVEDIAKLPRLGEDLAKQNILTAAAQHRTIAVLQEFKEICDQHNVTNIAAVGTAALRRAENSSEFIKAVATKTGIEIEIISAEKEAQLSFAAAKKDFGKEILVLDIGGGSTELIKPDDRCDNSWVSLPFGTVTLTEKFLASDPVTADELQALCAYIDKQIESISPAKHATLVATAGTPTTLAAMELKLAQYDHTLVHGFHLQKTSIETMIAQLESLNIKERQKLAGLHPKRADVILAGANILLKIIKHLELKEVVVSDRGVRWGLLYEHFLDTAS